MVILNYMLSLVRSVPLTLQILFCFIVLSFSHVPTTSAQLTDAFCARKKMHEANHNQYIPYLTTVVKDTQYPELGQSQCMF